MMKVQLRSKNTLMSEKYEASIDLNVFFYLAFKFKCFINVDELFSATHFSHPLIAFFHNLKKEEAGIENGWVKSVFAIPIDILTYL